MVQILRRRGVISAVAGLGLLYAAASAAFYLLMKQPPETFARGVSKLPTFVMPVLPFPRLWAAARAGSLQPGDMAPEFDLETLDRKSRVQLAQYRGTRPVVLIFGSYT